MDRLRTAKATCTSCGRTWELREYAFVDPQPDRRLRCPSCLGLDRLPAQKAEAHARDLLEGREPPPEMRWSA